MRGHGAPRVINMVLKERIVLYLNGCGNLWHIGSLFELFANKGASGMSR